MPIVAVCYAGLNGHVRQILRVIIDENPVWKNIVSCMLVHIEVAQQPLDDREKSYPYPYPFDFRCCRMGAHR